MPTKRLRRRPGQPISPEERTVIQETFLKTFRDCCSVRKAAEVAGIDRGTVYDWRRAYPDFAKRFEEAELDANDHIRDEIVRRAVTGWEEPVVSAGKLVTTVHKYSDTLLIFLAKARMPNEFRDNVTVNGNLTVGAYRVIEEASTDPETTQLANDLLKRIAAPTTTNPASPSDTDRTSGTSVSSDQE